MSHHLENNFKIPQNKHVSKRGVQLTSQFKRRMFFSKLGQLLAFFAFIGIIVALGWIILYGPIRTESGWVTPKIPPRSLAAEDVVIITDEGDSPITRLKESVIIPSEVITGKIIAGPYGVMSGSDGDYSVKYISLEANTNVILGGSHQKKLDQEYIVRCASGPCEVGKDYIYQASQVKGLYVEKSDKN